jgi:hypothetical protein
MDYQIFCTKMESLRKWTPMQAHEEWNRLKSDPANVADHKGPAPHLLRLRIPTHLVGEDWSESSEAEFEVKEFGESRMHKALSDQEKAAAKSEMTLGLTHSLSTPAQGSFRAPVPQTAVTYEGELVDFKLSDILAQGGDELAATGARMEPKTQAQVLSSACGQGPIVLASGFVLAVVRCDVWCGACSMSSPYAESSKRFCKSK